MIGNFRHNLHIINSRIDIVAVVQVLRATLQDEGESLEQQHFQNSIILRLVP